MRILILAFCLFASSSAFAITTEDSARLSSGSASPTSGSTSPRLEMSALAFWTGNKQQFQKAGGQMEWKCEYRMANTTRMILVWRTFSNSCPAEIDVDVEGE
jgi:hypothetical protein